MINKSSTLTAESAAYKRNYRDVEAAEYLGISKHTLRRWRLDPEKKLGPKWLKIGSSVRYPSESLDAWLSSLPGGGSKEAA